MLIAELFQRDVRTVNEHLQDIYREGEIEGQATIRKFRIVRREGPREVEREIEQFAARRRALLEAEAEREQSQPLEDAARKLPERPQRKRH